MRIFFQSKWFRHLHDLSDVAERRERVIATARVFLAATALVYTRLSPIVPIQNSEPVVVLLSGYLVLSLVLWLTLRSKAATDSSIRIGAHAADLLCTTALTVLSRGPESPFFLFFVFVLLAAAYRWGFIGTMGTAGAGVVLLAAEAYALLPTSIPATAFHHAGIPMARPFDFTQLVLRCAYLLMVGLLLGYLAERERALQSEAAATAQIIGRAHVGGGLKATLEGMLGELLAAFDSTRALLSAEETETGRMFLWEAHKSGPGRQTALDVREVERKKQGEYRLPEKASGWFARKTRTGTFEVNLLVPETSGAVPASNRMPAELAPCAAVLATPFRLGKEWAGWVCLCDAGTRFGWKRQLRLLRRIVDAAAPAAYNAFLLSRMRWQIGAQERARLARELHDGAIQSLVSAELQMHAMRRRNGADPAGKSGQMDQVEDLIHEQVVNLRELMEEIRPIDPDPRRLPELIAEQVEKFQRETGIEATFTSDETAPLLTGRVCRELMRITQELLFNVRRHSGAKSVQVRLGSQDGACRLEVADDGRGFDFAGRFDLAALEGVRKGPRVVQERLRVLGGNLMIESQPGKGSRLEISVPRREE